MSTRATGEQGGPGLLRSGVKGERKQKPSSSLSRECTSTHHHEIVDGRVAASAAIGPPASSPQSGSRSGSRHFSLTSLSSARTTRHDSIARFATLHSALHVPVPRPHRPARSEAFVATTLRPPARPVAVSVQPHASSRTTAAGEVAQAGQSAQLGMPDKSPSSSRRCTHVCCSILPPDPSSYFIDYPILFLEDRHRFS
jgi:hypothetical protein